MGILIAQTSFDEAKRQEVDRRVLAEVERMKAHGPTAYELALAKNAIRASVILALEDAVGQATALGDTEARYGYQSLGDRLARLEQLTADEVRDAARQFLNVENLTLYHYAPNGTAIVERDAALAKVREAVATVPPAPAATALPPTAGAVAPATVDRPAVEHKLTNGARLIVRERPGAPAVAIGVLLQRRPPERVVGQRRHLPAHGRVPAQGRRQALRRGNRCAARVLRREPRHRSES